MRSFLSFRRALSFLPVAKVTQSRRYKAENYKGANTAENDDENRISLTGFFRFTQSGFVL